MVDVDVSTSTRLPFQTDLLTASSRAKDPAALVRLFAQGLRRLYGRRGVLLLSTHRLNPGDYAVGVDTKWQQQRRIWVVKNSERLFVIRAVCTHLGCTPDWKASENKFKCPCHGSGYDSEGINFEGPAPRPMDRAHVSLDATGQIVVDTNRLYDWQKGGTNKFDEPGAYLSI